MDIVEDFKTLFEGNNVAYGGDDGVCIKEPVTDLVWHGHLYGKQPIGIYPIRTNGDGPPYVKWACSDIDVDDYSLAESLSVVLHKMGMNAWIERSKSKGFHVWVFFTDWVWAAHARNMMLLAHQVAELEAKEVNPKQISLRATKGYGNYVRLPYDPDAVRQSRKVMLYDDQRPMALGVFLQAATTLRVGPSAVEAWAGRYERPVVKTGLYRPTVENPVMSPLSKHILERGPGEGFDRSTTLLRLANHLAEDGFGSDVTYHLVRAADTLWGKFSQRNDVHERISEIIDKAYVQEPS
jgi:hypothetical protein